LPAALTRCFLTTLSRGSTTLPADTAELSSTSRCTPYRCLAAKAVIEDEKAARIAVTESVHD
jgi:hypothetical protein